jgi:hypothetical protein
MHPMLDNESIIDKLEKNKTLERKRFEVLEEEREQYQKAIKKVFCTDEGRLFLKKFLGYCGLFKADDSMVGVDLVRDKALTTVYLRLIRPFLDSETKFEVEK